MPKDIKTNVIVDVKTKGVSDADQKTSKFNKSITKALREQTKGFTEAIKSIEKLCEATVRAGQKTERTTKRTTEAIKRKTAAEKEAARVAKSALREAEREASRAARQAQQDEQKRKGAFRQGLAQGGFPLPAPFLQRGPGMGRQLAGMGVGAMVGGTFRRGLGIGRGLAGSAFSGLGGIQQALAGIPIVGGAAAGMVATAAGFSQQHIQLQRQRIGMASILNSPIDRQRALQSAGRASAQLQELKAQELSVTKSAKSPKIDMLRDKLQAEIDDMFPSMIESASTPIITAAEKRAGDIELAQAKVAIQKEKIKKLKGRAARTGMESVGALGLNLLGVSIPEAEQAAAGIVQAGGGRIGEAQRQGMIRAGFGARTAYGVQEGVAGAFLKGGRRGGLEGARGQAGRAMTEAIQDGLRLGLEGSEINDYLQSIASGIQQFEMTGIPVAKDSIAGMSQAFAVAGIASTRASKLGQGITSYAQSMGQRGIKSGMDLLILQRLGGFKGGGAKELQDAFIQLEKMKVDIQGKGVNDFNVQDATSSLLLEVMQKGGGGTSGEFELQSVLKSMNANMSNTEIRLLAKKLRKGKLTPDEQKEADAAAKQRLRGEREASLIEKRGLGGLASSAVNRLGSAAKKQADIQNQQIEVGAKMTPAVQALEQSALSTTKAFTTLVDGPLANFGKWLERSTTVLSNVVTKSEKEKLSLIETAKEVWKTMGSN